MTSAYDWSTAQQRSTTGGDTGTTVTTYDDTGRAATTRTAGSSGSDADTLTYTYYRPDATGTCNSVEWAGLLCKTAPAAAITGGGSNPSWCGAAWLRSGRVRPRSASSGRVKGR
ncbi:hypothetical protein [Streptomyces sp. NPDC001816]|uniref:hypothetical protein n=1 Tax=Streptomyces sp. NPDC001816 TaxID=3364612 RepID=UPI00367F6CCF